MAARSQDLCSLQIVPAILHFLKLYILQLPPLVSKMLFHSTEALRKFPVGPVQGRFRIDFQTTAEIHNREENVSQFLLKRADCSLSSSVIQLIDLLQELVRDAFDARPVKADAGGSCCDLIGPVKGGELIGNPIQEGLLSGYLPPAGFSLGFLEALPVAKQLL